MSNALKYKNILYKHIIYIYYNMNTDIINKHHNAGRKKVFTDEEIKEHLRVYRNNYYNNKRHTDEVFRLKANAESLSFYVPRIRIIKEIIVCPLCEQSHKNTPLHNKRHHPECV